MTSRHKIAVPFMHPPLLPVVPPPGAGETLSGWVASLGAIYGLTAAGLLRTMGVSPPGRLRMLDIAPSQPVLAALSAQTGVDAAFLQERMTFHRLGRELVRIVLAAGPHCPDCAAARDAAGRKVERLRSIAPWVFACEQHVLPIVPDELDPGLDVAAMRRDLARFSTVLDNAACQEACWPFPAIRRGTADCIRLVRAINDRLRLWVRTGSDGTPVFDVVALQDEAEDSIAPARRNSRVVSAWYAWHVISAPDQLLLRHTRNRDRAQLRALVRLLFDFLPAGLFVAADRRGVVPDETVAADPPDAADPVHQARLLRAPVRLTFSMDRLLHSPFDYADFGRPFTPSLLPSQSDCPATIRMVHFGLAQHEALARGKGGDHMNGGLAALLARGSARGFAINGDNTCGNARHRADPGDEAALELIGVERREDIAEVIMRRRAILERAEPAEQLKLLGAEKCDLREAFRASQHGKQAQQQNLIQRVGHLAKLAMVP